MKAVRSGCKVPRIVNKLSAAKVHHDIFTSIMCHGMAFMLCLMEDCVCALSFRKLLRLEFLDFLCFIIIEISLGLF